MLVTDNKELLRLLFEEGFCRANLALLDEIIAPDFKLHGLPGPTDDSSPAEALKKDISVMLHVFPDVSVEVQNAVSSGDRVAGRIVMKGTLEGELGDIPPTGRPVELQALAVLRIDGGRIAEAWVQYDMAALAAQVGACPGMGDSSRMR